MALPMRSSQFKGVVEPILNKTFDSIYDQRSEEWKTFCDEHKGIQRNYHEEQTMYQFGAAPELPDGTAVTYGGGGVLFTQRYVYKVYGLAFALTKVLVEDGDYIRLGQIFSKGLAQSLVETKETLCANILNRAFNSSFTGGDGVSLVNTAHPIANGLTFSNQLTTAAALSQTSLEQMLIQIRNAVDNTGKRINLKPQKLILSPANVFQGEVLLKTVLRTGTANNDINPVKSLGMLSGGQANVARLTSNTAWWVQTDAQKEGGGPGGIKLMMRRPIEKSMEGDFETDSMKYKATERYSVGWTDPRCVWGTPGL